MGAEQLFRAAQLPAALLEGGVGGVGAAFVAHLAEACGGREDAEAAVVAIEPSSREAFFGEVTRFSVKVAANAPVKAKLRLVHKGVAVQQRDIELKTDDEPEVGASGSVRAEAIHATYPDGRHDAETVAARRRLTAG